VDRNLSGPRLAERFGESFHAHRAAHPEPPRVTPAPGREIEPLAGATREERAADLVARVNATRASFSEADLKRAALMSATPGSTSPKIPLVHHTWDALDPRLRGDICVEVGLAEEAGRRSAEDLDTSLREVISWRFEVLRRVRIGFAPKGRRP
jgi:hypothetical protein